MPLYTAPFAQPAAGTSTDGITAAAGGGYANAVQLVSRFNHVSTVATTGDSVRLPPCVPNLALHVSNDGVNALSVFPYGNGIDRLNNSAVGASISVPAGKTMSLTGTGSPGRWHELVSA